MAIQRLSGIMLPVAIIDISKELSEQSEAYPGDPPFRLGWVSKLSDGSAANVSEVRGSSHLATHIDLPSHLFHGAENPPLNSYVGQAIVTERPIDPLPSGFRVLVKGAGPLTESEAQAIVDSGSPLVGVEAMSVDDLDSNELTNHRILLAAGVAILENIDLSAVGPGMYELIALPLKIKGAEATWVRAVLRSP